MTARRAFPCRRDSAGLARRFARDTLTEEPSKTREAVELMVSELATNCIQHAESDFEISIELAPDAIRVEAIDRGGGHPTPRTPGPAEPTGRGLMVVRSLADSWGIDPREPGKSVWFTVAREPRDSGADRRLGRSAA